MVDDMTMRIENADAVTGSGFVQYPKQERFADVKFQPLTHVQEPPPVATDRRPSAGGNSTNWKADKAQRSAAKSHQQARGGYPQAHSAEADVRPAAAGLLWRPAARLPSATGGHVRSTARLPSATGRHVRPTAR